MAGYEVPLSVIKQLLTHNTSLDNGLMSFELIYVETAVATHLRL